MKKIILASTLIATGIAMHSVAYANGGSLAGATANSVGTGTGNNNCELLNAAIKVSLSQGNLGYYDCNTTTASVGVAVASTTGRNMVYSLGSAGGAITTATTSSAPSTTNCQTAATTSSATS
jgi:hypothetical protein